MYGWSAGKPVQLTAIWLPADTPVTNGSVLPLKVHCGPVLAATEGDVADPVAPPGTNVATPQDSSRTDATTNPLPKRANVTLHPPQLVEPARAQDRPRIVATSMPVCGQSKRGL